jgi:hypothetical protein
METGHQNFVSDHGVVNTLCSWRDNTGQQRGLLIERAGESCPVEVRRHASARLTARARDYAASFRPPRAAQ